MTIYLYFQSDNSSQNSNSSDFSRMYVLLEFHEIFFDYLLWCYVILTNEQPIRKPRVGFPHVRRDGTFSIMALRAVRSTRVDGCWFYLPVLLHILDASPDRNWANLTLSSLDLLNEWTVGGCQNSVLLCWEQSHCFLRGALNPQPNLDCCLWCSLVISFSWCVWDVERRPREQWRGEEDMETSVPQYYTCRG